MASSWSALKVELLETGQNSGQWGSLTNVNLGDAVLGEAITGQATVDFPSDADVTITLTDFATTQAARNLRLNITESGAGIGSVRNLILGSGCQIEKFYLINNTGTGAKTVKNTSGTGISVPAGKATLVFNNGTNVVDAASYFTSLTLGSALPAASGGTGVANNAAMTVTGSGNFAYTRTLTGTTNVTFPTTGTLATLAGSETLSNKTLTAPALGTPTSGILSACTVDGTNKVGYLNIPQSGSAKVSSYTLVVGDVGKFVVLGTSGLVVVPASIFAVGDAISVANNTAAAITCTSSAVTAYLGGTNTIVTSFSLASRGVCTILYVTASVVFITGNVS